MHQAFWLLVALLGPTATVQTVGSPALYASAGTSCCLRPVGSQEEFEVGMVLNSDEDFNDRREYYADFGKEMVPEGSMVLYKGRMGLLNADCSVTGLDLGFPIRLEKSHANRGLVRHWIPFTAAAMTLFVFVVG